MRLPRIASLWGPVATYLILLTSLSRRHDLPQIHIGDKIMHVAAYTALGVLALRAFHGGITRLRPKAVLGAVTLTVGYGLIDEVQQGFVAGRDASGYDVIADVGGAVLAVLLVAVMARLLEQRRPETPEPGM